MKIGDKVIERNSKKKGTIVSHAFAFDWLVDFVGDNFRLPAVPCDESELILQSRQLEFAFTVEDVTTAV